MCNNINLRSQYFKSRQSSFSCIRRENIPLCCQTCGSRKSRPYLRYHLNGFSVSLTVTMPAYSNKTLTRYDRAMQHEDEVNCTAGGYSHISMSSCTWRPGLFNTARSVSVCESIYLSERMSYSASHRLVTLLILITVATQHNPCVASLWDTMR